MHDEFRGKADDRSGRHSCFTLEATNIPNAYSGDVRDRNIIQLQAAARIAVKAMTLY